jgi:hypothetical protein
VVPLAYQASIIWTKGVTCCHEPPRRD